MEDKNILLKRVKESLKASRYSEAFNELCAFCAPLDDFALQSKYAAYYKSMAAHLEGLKGLRLAVAATSTAGHFLDVLKFWLAKEGLTAEIYEAAYGTFHQVILDPHSELYAFKPDVVLLFANYRDFDLDVPFGSTAQAVEEKIVSAVNGYMGLATTLKDRLNCRVIMNNADLPYSRVFGHYESMAPWGLARMLQQFNLRLAAAAEPGIAVVDMDFLSSAYGKQRWHEARFWHHSKHAFGLDATGLVAQQTAKLIAAGQGLSKKCLVVDLDNTLWGGTIGDDGLEGIQLGAGPAGEAYVAFQKFLLGLKNRGILLTVCSKNEDNLAREPFLRHPDMLIKLEDIVVFKANWENKAENITQIAAQLNIGLDALVFIDDNPVERDLVRKLLPTVCVPELSVDPANYVDDLCRESYFETAAFSQEDSARTQYYRADLKRSDAQKAFTDTAEYLQSLQMEMTVGRFDDFNIPRVEQLINKSNQFHLTTTRYSAGEIRCVMESPHEFGFAFRLKDRFGDNGLIAAVILKTQEDGALFIDTWVMSCRVLSRGVEEFVCAEIIAFAQHKGYKKITGKYISTKKNKLVCGLYRRLGFHLVSEQQDATWWEMDLLNNHPVYKPFIKREGIG